MVGTVLATLGVLVGIRLVVGLVRRRRAMRMGFGGGCGMSRFHGGGHHRGFGRHGGIGQSFWLRRAFAKLDTTPGQEKEIKAALEELRDTANAQRDRRGVAGARLADALEEDVFVDAPVIAEVRGAADEMQDALSRAMHRIASALDDKQRKQLAAWLRARGRFGRFGGPFGGFGPYRTSAVTL